MLSCSRVGQVFLHLHIRESGPKALIVSRSTEVSAEETTSTEASTGAFGVRSAYECGIAGGQPSKRLRKV
jgi:hypothetical protein